MSFFFTSFSYGGGGGGAFSGRAFFRGEFTGGLVWGGYLRISYKPQDDCTHATGLLGRGLGVLNRFMYYTIYLSISSDALIKRHKESGITSTFH